jgi:hypothetical protein
MLRQPRIFISAGHGAQQVAEGVVGDAAQLFEAQR